MIDRGRLLSLQQHDEVRILRDDRRVLRERELETHILRFEIVDRLVRERNDFVFKPVHGFAGRGLLDSGSVGCARLWRLVNHGSVYVAQRRVPKSTLDVREATPSIDVRLWAYRGAITLVSRRRVAQTQIAWAAAGGPCAPIDIRRRRSRPAEGGGRRFDRTPSSKPQSAAEFSLDPTTTEGFDASASARRR